MNVSACMVKNVSGLAAQVGASIVPGAEGILAIFQCAHDAFITHCASLSLTVELIQEIGAQFQHVKRMVSF